jgi:hypothetical protein
MITKENFVTNVCQKAQILDVGQYLDIRSYKRNRSVLLIRLQNDYRLIENGFRKLDINLDFDELKSTLKTIERIEFPRSHTIRIYKMDNFDETKINLKRKKI